MRKREKTKRATDLIVMNTERVKQRQKPLLGKPPAVVLLNPKYPVNVGQAWRACSGFGVSQIWLTGHRIIRACDDLTRFPREERMKGYKKVTVIQDDHFFDRFDQGTVVPVCVEICESSENLAFFEHPENALYVFGPEDGSVDKWVRRFCHRFLFIPTCHCLNLASAVCTILYDRRAKRMRAGLEPVLPVREMLDEHRGFISDS